MYEYSTVNKEIYTRTNIQFLRINFVKWTNQLKLNELT